MIPYGYHSINDDDIAAVVAALKSDWLTTGPLVEQFEAALEKVARTPKLSNDVAEVIGKALSK